MKFRTRTFNTAHVRTRPCIVSQTVLREPRVKYGRQFNYLLIFIEFFCAVLLNFMKSHEL